jgi:hypothetical protein
MKNVILHKIIQNITMVIRLMGWEVQTGWRHFYIRKLQTLVLTGIEEEK